MRIAQVAPLWETVPPQTYGGTELVAHWLTEELLRRGHEVTLFAAEGSQTLGRLETLDNTPFRQKGVQLIPYHELRLLERVLGQAAEFDVIHNHLGLAALPLAGLTPTPMLTTLHGAFKPQALREFILHYAHLPYVSISDFQRLPCPSLHYVGTVHHGLPLEEYPPALSQKRYLVFLGRFSAEKGPHLAIQMARETGWPLVMAGKVDSIDKEYFRLEIEPWIDGQQIRFIGEVNHAEKIELLRHAAATLCPVLWPEPFGLVLIESLACGTPVLALRNGSVPEIIQHGKTGFIADSVEELTAAVARIGDINRTDCRQAVVRDFSVARMTDRYLKVYQKLLRETNTPTTVGRSAVLSLGGRLSDTQSM